MVRFTKKNPERSRSEADKVYEVKRRGTRSRNWIAILYPDDLPDDWLAKLAESTVKCIVSPFHQYDLNPDLTPKKPHHHVLLMFTVVKNDTQVIDFFKNLYGSSGDSIVGVAKPEICVDRVGSVRYMTHRDNPEKYQYPSDDLLGLNGADPFELLRPSMTDERDLVIEMEQFIEANGITELADFSKMIRDSHNDWYLLLINKKTFYFSHFLRSRRYIEQKRKNLS